MLCQIIVHMCKSNGHDTNDKYNVMYTHKFTTGNRSVSFRYPIRIQFVFFSISIRGVIRCHDGFQMSIQASRDHYCTPRDDTGPYSAVEVGWPNRLEGLLLPYVDKATTITGMRPTLYVNVPARVIHEVVAVHAGISSGQLPPLIELDRGYAWAEAAIPPSDLSNSMDEGNADDEEGSVVEEAPTSVIHMGAPQPPPPPLPHTTENHNTGPLRPPTTLMNAALSPTFRHE